jgi:hypothetical protein
MEAQLIGKSLATIADILLFGGAALLAKEAFARQKDLQETANTQQALQDAKWKGVEFVSGKVEFRGDDADLRGKLEQINAQRNRPYLNWGIALTLLGFAVHLVEVWVY